MRSVFTRASVAVDSLKMHACSTVLKKKSVARSRNSTALLTRFSSLTPKIAPRKIISPVPAPFNYLLDFIPSEPVCEFLRSTILCLFCNPHRATVSCAGFFILLFERTRRHFVVVKMLRFKHCTTHGFVCGTYSSRFLNLHEKEGTAAAKTLRSVPTTTGTTQVKITLFYNHKHKSLQVHTFLTYLINSITTHSFTK